jgi:hypothetical protein
VCKHVCRLCRFVNSLEHQHGSVVSALRGRARGMLYSDITCACRLCAVCATAFAVVRGMHEACRGCCFGPIAPRQPLHSAGFRESMAVGVYICGVSAPKQRGSLLFAVVRACLLVAPLSALSAIGAAGSGAATRLQLACQQPSQLALHPQFACGQLCQQALLCACFLWIDTAC